MTNLIKTSLILAVFGMAISFSSCKKCTDCTYTWDYGDGGSGEFAFGEQCGKKSEIEDFEKVCEDGAADQAKKMEDLGYEGSASCTCN